MAPHSSTLAWKIPWTEEPGGLQSMRLLRVEHYCATSLSCIGGGNGNLLQCSCLENPRDGGAWWAAVYGVAQIWTRLKRLSIATILPTTSFQRAWPEHDQTTQMCNRKEQTWLHIGSVPLALTLVLRCLYCLAGSDLCERMLPLA